MTVKFLLPLFLGLLAASCSKKAIVVEEPPVEAPRTTKAAGGPASPLPALSDNPFAVPDVTNDLPKEEDLKSRTPQPPGIPIEPVDKPDDPQATVTARPPAAPAVPPSPDSEE